MSSPLPRLTVALTFDPDALSDAIRRSDPPDQFFRGEFGIRVATPRILALLERHGVESTWFVPGHTLATFPAAIESVVAAGHEIAAHGWYHEDFAILAADEQRAILERSRDAIAGATGSSPAGMRAPYWSVGPDTLAEIEAAGYAYDSSLSGGDLQPYRPRHGDRHSLDGGTTWGTDGRLVEVPVYSALNDWYVFEPGPGRDALAAPAHVLEIWTEELRWAWEHEPGGILTITMHPECIGRPHRMAMLERFVEYAEGLEGVVFGRIDRYVAAWLASPAGRPAGHGQDV